jgi:hypothetical protein
MDVYSAISERIIEKLEAGTVPWHKPWRSIGAPRNLVSKKLYRGINVWLLTMQGYTSPYWATIRQINELGGSVRKGGKATPVVFWRVYVNGVEVKDRRAGAGRPGDGSAGQAPICTSLFCSFQHGAMRASRRDHRETGASRTAATRSTCTVNCTADDDAFQDLVQHGLGKIERAGKPPDYSMYPATVSVVSLIQLPPEYHRAIAKIAFHFFLWCGFPQITGFEPEFNAIKQFIRRGGDPHNYMRSATGAFERNQIGEAPYAHVLAAGISGNQAVATVQLFAGSGTDISLIACATDGRSFPVQLKSMSFMWIVALGPSPFRLGYDLRRSLAF